MKKRIWILILVIICSASAAKGTIAYFTAEDTVRNVITSGDVKVTLIDQQRTDGQLHAFPDEPIAAKPGSSISKIVSVRCEEEAAWIRVKCEVRFFDAQQEPMNLDAEKIEKIVGFETDTDHWEYRDGWWYYLQPLAKGDTTEALFEQVTFAKTMGNAFQKSTVKFSLFVQAVQTANNGNEVWEADGWPEN